MEKGHGSGGMPLHEAVSTAELQGSGVNRWLSMEAVSTAELHGSGVNRWLNMEAVLLIAHETLTHGSGENRAFFKKSNFEAAQPL